VHCISTTLRPGESIGDKTEEIVDVMDMGEEHLEELFAALSI
jgi:hypothetical protein